MSSSLSESLATGTWRSLYNVNSFGNIVKLDYNLSTKKILFYFDKPNVPGRTFNAEFDVQSPTAVRIAEVKLKEILKHNVSVRLKVEQELIAKLKELEYLSPGECEVAHFSVKLPTEGSNILTLISQFKAVENSRSPAEIEGNGSIFYRSVPLLKIRTIEPSRLFQLRVVVSDDNSISKFSIVNLEGDLKNYEIIFENGHIIVKDKKQNTLFILKIDDLSLKGARLSLIKKSGLDEVEDIEKSHFFLKLDNENWRLLKYSESRQDVVSVQDEVVLTHQSVIHQPVVRVHNSDQYFQTYSDKEIIMIFKSAFHKEFENGNKEKTDLFKLKYQSCMLENIQLISGQGIDVDQETILKACEKNAILYVAYANTVDTKNNYFSQLNLSAIEVESLKNNISKNFKLCLVENKLLDLNQHYTAINFETMTKLNSIKDLRVIIDSCLLNTQNLVGNEVVALSFQSDNQLSITANNDNELANLVVEEVVVEGLQQCNNALNEDLRIHCNKFIKHVKEDVIFEYIFRSFPLAIKTTLIKCNKSVHAKLLHDLKIGNTGVVAFTNAQTKQLNCAKKALRDSKHVSDIATMESFLYEIEFIKKLGIRVSESFKEKINTDVELCINKSLETHEDLSYLMSHHDQDISNCKLSVLKNHIPELYQIYVNMISENYTDDKEIQKYLEGRLSRNISNKIRNLLSTEEINSAIEEDYIFITSLTISKLIENDLRNSFPEDVSEDLEYQYNLDSFDALDKRLHFLLGDVSGNSLRSALISYSKRGYDKGKKRGVEIFANEFLVNYEKEKSEYILVRDISKQIKDEDIKVRLVNKINEEYLECLKEYSPNENHKKVITEIRICQKKRLGAKIFALAKDDFELLVASHFPKSSIKVNNILTPIHYMNECIEKIDIFKDMSVSDYKNYANACADVTLFNISHNLSLNLIEDYKPVLVGGDIVKAVENVNTCYKKIFQSIHESAESSELSYVSVDDASGSHSTDRSLGQLLESLSRANLGAISFLSITSDEHTFSYDYKKNDIKNIKRLLSTIAKNKNINRRWLLKETKDCQRDLKDDLYEGFRAFILKSVPDLDHASLNNAGETNRDVFEKLIDLELIDLIIKFKSIRSDSAGVLNSSLPPRERVITPALGLNAMTNMINVVGAYISKGFIFDQERMKTELIIFKSELKNALIYINTTPGVVRVSDLNNFFTESTIADHLALAQVSENVHGQFLNFIIDMEREDFTEFKRRTNNNSYSQLSVAQRSDYNFLKNKYRKLRELVKTMTSSYDFRRIMRTGSVRGKKLLGYIKENYILPQILGDRVSPAVKRKISYDIARLIIEDNTEGGFAEQFVHRVAQQSLSAQANNKWSITKWLFYSKGDFDWTSLRKTASGRKAIEYYSQYILLPRILDSNLSVITKRQRKEKFEQLLSDAQSEN
jgi:hypothetical protein